MNRLFVYFLILILSIVANVSPSQAAVDKCISTKKFKEINSRTLQNMKKNLKSYENQGFILQGKVDYFNGETVFFADWYGKGSKDYVERLYGIGTVYDGTKKRIANLVDNDNFKARVILIDRGIKNSVPPIFSVCSVQLISRIS